MNVLVKSNKIMPRLACFLMLAFLAACGSEEAPVRAVNNPVAIESGDECHLCGMVIKRFPGPKGELFEGMQGHQSQVKKFCSTRDLLAYYFQPENQHHIEEIYVHNMADTTWNSPDDSHLVNARDSWFVIGSEKKGAMGPTLATFAQKKHAEFFAKNYSGEIYSFDQLSLEMINSALNEHQNDGHMEMSHHH